MRELMTDGLREFLKPLRKFLGAYDLLDCQGQSIAFAQLPEQMCLAAISYEGRTVGYVRAAAPDACDAYATCIISYLKAHKLQRETASLQSRLIEEIRVRTELEEALKFMELKALQSQVNPHFLFNTLATIAGVALLEGAPENPGRYPARAQ